MQRIQLATSSRVSRAIDEALHGALHPAREIAYLTQNTTHRTNMFILYWLTGIGETKVIISIAQDLLCGNIKYMLEISAGKIDSNLEGYQGSQITCPSETLQEISWTAEWRRWAPKLTPLLEWIRDLQSKTQECITHSLHSCTAGYLWTNFPLHHFSAIPFCFFPKLESSQRHRTSLYICETLNPVGSWLSLKPTATIDV